MSKLLKQAEVSKLNRIKIEDGNSTFTINIYKELRVDEEVINDEIANHTRVFGYLSMLHNQLVEEVKSKELAADKLKGNLSKDFENQKNPSTSRPFSKDAINNRLLANPKYYKLLKGIIALERKRDDIKTCLKSFEQRKDLIQTISANRRVENK